MKKLAVIGVIAALVTTSFAGDIYFLPENMNEVIGSRSVRSGLRADVPARLSALLDELKDSDKEVKNNFDKIGEVIHKQWYLNSEFEKDRNIMLNFYRESLEKLSNLNDRLQGLEVELFNPEELGFKELYNGLEKATKNLFESYKQIEIGKAGLKNGKDLFGKAKADYAKFTANLARVISTVSGAVPYTPDVAPTPVTPQEPVVTEPQPTINYNAINVTVMNKKTEVFGLDIVNSNSYEGKLVVKKSKERLHELSSTDRLMFKEALKGQDGFSFIIVKDSDNYYTIYWWHIGNDIQDIFETIEDIFN